MSDAIRRSIISRRPGLFVAAAAGVGVALALASGVLDSAPTREARKNRIEDAQDILAPRPLSDEEVRSRGSLLASQERVALGSGAWVQVADDQGRLKQQYRADRIDPEADKWIRMEKPRATMYPDGSQVVLLSSDFGRVRVPKRAIQSGRLEGNVLIKLFRQEGTEPIDFSKQKPAVVIKAPEAQFDDVLGEVRCDKSVQVVATSVKPGVHGDVQQVVSFQGVGLSVVIDQTQHVVERLVVERPLGPIVIERRLLETKTAAAPRNAVAAAPAAVAAATPSSPPAGSLSANAPTSVAAAGNAPAGAAPAAPSAAPAAPSASPAAPGPSAPKYYRLVLNDAVKIQRFVLVDGAAASPGAPITFDEKNSNVSVVTGDHLIVHFAMGGKDLAMGGAGTDPTLVADGGAWLGGDWPTRLAVLSLTADGETKQKDITMGDNEDITITYEGRLVMQPASDGASILKNGDDVQIEVDGRRVELEDRKSLRKAHCARLVYRASDDKVDLITTEAQRLEVEGPDLRMDGGNFRLERQSGTGTLEGPGKMILKPGKSAPADGARNRGVGAAPPEESKFLASTDSWAAIYALGITSNAAPPPATPAGAAPPARPSPGDSLPKDLEIVWDQGVDLKLGGEHEGGKLKTAKFRGAVKVANVDFDMNSRDLEVDFREGVENAIEKIIASGGDAPDSEGRAQVRRNAEGSSLAAETLELNMTQGEGENGSKTSVPSQLIASGRVRASDKAQTLWTERLDVTFRPVKKPADGEAAPKAGDPGPFGAMAGNVEVDRVKAEKSVQVLLKDGARVFAEGLDGDAPNKRVTLTGPDVMIIRENVVADHLMKVEINEAERIITADGPGRFRYYRSALGDSKPQMISRPSISEDSKTELTASWNEGMKYNDKGNGGGGTLDLAGIVRVRAERSPLDYSILDSQQLQLDLKRETGKPIAARATPAPQPGGAASATAPPTSASPASDAAAPGATSTEPGDAFASGARSIERLIAKGDARLESQTYSTPEHTDPPKLFRVTGQHVEYNTVTGEASVVGNGEFLVHDVTEDKSRPAREGLWDGRGSTAFKWNGNMDMKRLQAPQYLVTMSDGVTMLHVGVRKEDSLKLTSDRLEATILRKGVGEVAPQAANPKQVQGAVPDLGGAAEMLRVHAIGRVFVSAPEAQIDCDDFDYDNVQQIAQITARPGRTVKVLKQGNAQPLQATSVLWDLKNGKMTIQSGSGGIGR